MPTAGSFNDGDLSFSSSKIGPNLRNTIGFQALPRVYGAFRYSGIGDREKMYYRSGYTTWDRSFDIRLDLIRQNKWLPDITVGLQDTIGTGLHSAEYLVASKTVLKKLRATIGLGWGRLASRNVVSNTGIRNGNSGGDLGGLLRTASFFRGNTGAFGGLEYDTPIDGLNLKLELSSDDYSYDQAYSKNYLTSLTNYGLNYKLNNNLSTSVYYSSGREIGFQLNIMANPNNEGTFKFLEDVPEPFYSIPLPQKDNDNGYLIDIKKELEKNNVIYVGHKISDLEFLLIIDNGHYSTHTQSVGRSLRILSKYVPIDKTQFTVVSSHLGIPINQVSIEREKVSYIVDSPNAELLTKKITNINSASKVLNDAYIDSEYYPSISNSITPYARYHFFDPNRPLYWDIGIETSPKILLKPGLIFSGNISGSLISTFDEIQRGAKGRLTTVRTNQRDFLNVRDPRINNLILTSYYKLSNNTYGRFSLGYLEEMYGGLSAEVLKSPINSSLSYGLEINKVKYRDSRQLLDLRDLNGLSSTNGHLSTYWDTGFYDYHAQLDLGKYLAGDKGGTITLKRDFPNGWEIGGLFSLTDASFADFGEGSFDKAIFFKIPLNPILPYESRSSIKELIRPLNGDGGARVFVPGRLYNIVNEYSQRNFYETWPKLWQ